VKIRIDQPAKSGVLVAGDLVFFGEGNGKFHAWMRARARCCGLRRTADPSLHFVGGAESNPVAYMVKGREYIVNASAVTCPIETTSRPTRWDAFIALRLPATNEASIPLS